MTNIDLTQYKPKTVIDILKANAVYIRELEQKKLENVINLHHHEVG